MESPGEDQQTEGQLHPPGCQEAELPPILAPPPYILHCLFVCLFISLVCTLSTMCLMPLFPFFILLFLLFSTCPYLYICNSCIFVYVYIYIYIYDLYLSVCLRSTFSV